MEIAIALLVTLVIGAIVLLTSNRAAGWGLLAASYKTDGASHDIQWRFVSARMGAGSEVVPYRAALNIGANATGLYLSLFRPFRLGSPPLLIPWEHLSVNRPESASATVVEFHFLAAPSVYLRVDKNLAAAILAYKPSDGRFNQGPESLLHE